MFGPFHTKLWFEVQSGSYMDTIAGSYFSLGYMVHLWILMLAV